MTRYTFVDKRPAEGVEFDVEGAVVSLYQVSMSRVRLLVEIPDESSEPSGSQETQGDVDEDYLKHEFREDLKLADYRDLQQRAQQNDIKANQTTEELIDAIVEAEMEQ